MKVLRMYCLGTLNPGSVYWIVIVTVFNVALGGPPPAGITGVMKIWRWKLIKLLQLSGGQVPT
jgi:hypothetical protein